MDKFAEHSELFTWCATHGSTQNSKGGVPKLCKRVRIRSRKLLRQEAVKKS